MLRSLRRNPALTLLTGGFVLAETVVLIGKISPL